MKLNPDKATAEIEKLFQWFPRYGMTEAKEEALTLDLLEIAANWEEDAFLQACRRIRRSEKRFPLLADFESVYNQVLAEKRATRSEQDDLEHEYRRRMREHNETWSHLSASPDLPWIMEQATDEVDAALVKLEKRDESGQIIRSSGSELAKLFRRHRDESIRGRACQVWKENKE